MWERSLEEREPAEVGENSPELLHGAEANPPELLLLLCVPVWDGWMLNG